MPLDARELHRRINKLRKSLKNFPKNPRVDEVHDLRTRTRRVESILHGLKLDLPSNQATLLKELRPIRKRAGKVRDMDVFTSYVVGLGLNDDPDCLVRLVHHLGIERHRQSKKLHNIVQQYGKDSRSRLKGARRKLDSAIQRFERSKLELDSDSEANSAPLHAVSTALRLSQELGGVRRLGRNNLHAYRIEIKRLRYVLEIADKVSGPQHKLIQELKTVQDAIGEWHDWLELSGIARRLLPHPGRCRLSQVIEQTAARKFGEALRVTEQMRRRYLQTASRAKAPRSKPSKAVKGPVLVAASEIAA